MSENDQKKIVYVAEDQPLWTNLLHLALAGQENYRTVQENPPDLLVLVIILPSLNGLVISGLLKFNDTYSHIPILVISSVIDPEITECATKVGADAFLAKPFDENEFLNQMNRLIKTS